MFVGQNGFPKSGNYLLFTILKNILLELNIWNSYVSKYHYWTSDQMSFPDENEVDHIYIDENQQIFLKVAPVFAKRGGVIAEGGGIRSVRKRIWPFLIVRLV